MKPGHMLSTGYSVESLYPGMINQTHLKPLQWPHIIFRALFLLSPLYAPLPISIQICISVYIACAFLLLCFCLSYSFHLTLLPCQYPLSPFYKAANSFSFKSEHKVSMRHSLTLSLCRKWPILWNSYSLFHGFLFVFSMLYHGDLHT